ncbi:hypothetical protein HY494_02535 [Candidatus Woesearchaeota archaeon]|nr:hypothetical protein [Candidatus Woesearchaeota archaeon]
MHTCIHHTDNWTTEILADDSDQPNNHPTLETELQGCAFIKEVRDNNQYASEIRYEEQRHDELVYVEAIVFTVPAKLEEIGEETTEKDICYFRRNKFEGKDSKQEAARYAHRLKQDIDHLFFKNFRVE